MWNNPLEVLAQYDTHDDNNHREFIKKEADICLNCIKSKCYPENCIIYDEKIKRNQEETKMNKYRVDYTFIKENGTKGFRSSVFTVGDICDLVYAIYESVKLKGSKIQIYRILRLPVIQ